MPRRSRIDAPGALHHIIVRGIDGKSIFKDDADKDNFLERLKNTLTDSATLCFAWALIPNHFHLLLRTGSVPISIVMKRLLTGHAIFFAVPGAVFPESVSVYDDIRTNPCPISPDNRQSDRALLGKPKNRFPPPARPLQRDNRKRIC